MFGAPDPAFRLSSAERAALDPRYDADALERLLSHLPASARSPMLVAAASSDRRVKIESSRLRRIWQALWSRLMRERHGYLPVQLEDFEFSDETLQGMLEQVWRSRGRPLW